MNTSDDCPSHSTVSIVSDEVPSNNATSTDATVSIEEDADIITTEDIRVNNSNSNSSANETSDDVPPKKHACPLCEYKTTLKHNLNRHLRIHRSTTIQNIDPHLSRHIGGYDCKQCGEVFSQNSNMKRHMKRHNQLQMGDTPFQCDQCAYTVKI